MACIDLPLPLSLLMAPQAYRMVPQQPLGRQSAGAGFLEAYLRYGGNQRHHLVVTDPAHGKWFHSEACRHSPTHKTVVSNLANWGDSAAATGAISLPGPGLDEWAWKRMPWGDGAFSLVGLVHTLCSRPVQWGLGQFSAAPVRPWDALICTSTAARQVVEGFLLRQEAWLQRRVGATQFERPQLPVIPLGVHAEVWAPPGGKTQAMARARRKLNIPSEAVVVLLAGRLDVLTKFQPGPLLRALANLQRHELPNLRLLIYGEAPNAGMAELWCAGLADAAPRLPVHWVAGRDLELAGPVRWAADLFVSVADNPQETFGITPLEAMAAELPCLVSDWDGYRDTVTHDVGRRIPTRMVEGLGEAQSRGLLSESLAYDQAIGQISQGIAVEPQALCRQLLELLSHPQHLRTMGAAARQRVEQLYAWPTVIGQWRDLVQELQKRRHQAQAAAETTPAQLPPWLPSCTSGFGVFASEVIQPNPTLPSNYERTSLMNAAGELLTSPLDAWDADLREEFLLWEKDHSQMTGLSPRAHGWLLKQGLLKH